MKTKTDQLLRNKIIVMLILIFTSQAFSQSITNTLGTGGLFTIKDSGANF
ncbi:MAG: hypothetical protein ABI462_02885 [Ignavibacteria bacterium]